MSKEIEALLANNTWELVDLPPVKKAISNKWVYKVKLKSDGTLERLKARLVIRGFTQQYAVDYEEVFSPVVKMATIRCVIALAASKSWPLSQLDVIGQQIVVEQTQPHPPFFGLSTVLA